MKSFIFGMALLLLCSLAEAKDILLFNPDIFGQPTSTAIKSLQEKKSDEIEPVSVLLDIRCGKYYAASVFYPKKVTFADARQTVNKYYEKYEKQSLYKESEMAVWRVEDRQFAISITKEEYRIRIMFIQFQPTKQVWKDIMKSMGANTEILEENECKE